MFEPREYRACVQPTGLTPFDVRVEETDLMVMADTRLVEATRALVLDARGQIQEHIAICPEFRRSLRPLDKSEAHATELPPVVTRMYEASAKTETGPMAAVAGAVSEYVGRGLLEQTAEVIIENGGDIFLCTKLPRVVSIFAGRSSLSMKVGLRVGPGAFGVCTSSGTVGHSYSMGNADAATVVSPDTALADAAATALGNRVKTAADVQAALEWIQTIDGIVHAAVIVEETFGTWGEFEVVPLAANTNASPDRGGDGDPAKEG